MVQAADQPTTAFAEVVEKAMKAKELGIKELADATESTYEHIRKMLRGGSFPSKYFLRVLCDVLDLDLEEINTILVGDKLRHKFGDIPAQLAGLPPGLEPLKRIWVNLTPARQKDLIAQARTWAKKDGK